MDKQQKDIAKNATQRLRLRRATASDLEVLVSHRRSMWVDMGEKGTTKLREQDRAFRSWARSQIKSRTLLGWVVETDRGRIAASGTLWLRPAVPRPGFLRGFQPFLLSMYTEPEWRRHGLALRIVNEAIRWTRKEGFKEVLLHASPLGEKLYRSRGFQPMLEMRLDVA